MTIVESATRLKLLGDRRDLEQLSNHFKYRPKNYWRSPSYDVFVATNGARGWDGYQYPVKIIGAGVATALRGRLPEILSVADSYDIIVDRSRLLESPFKNIVVDDLPDNIVDSDFELDENQKTSVVSWLRAGMGVNKITVSGGKTVTACAAASAVKMKFQKARFLYVTPSERLVRQVVKEARRFLPEWNITQYGGGHADNTGKDMVVATVAMINRHVKKLDAEGWFGTFMGLIYDEVHHIISPTSEKIVLKIPAYFRFGCSDTIKSEDIDATNKLRGLAGNVLHEVAAHGMIISGRIAKPHIYVTDVEEWSGKYSDIGHAPEPDTEAWALIDGVWKKGTYIGPVYALDSDGEMKRDNRGNPVQIQGSHLLKIDGEEIDIPSKWCLLERTYDKAIIRFKERNELIGKWVKHYTEQGWPTLVVCTRTLHVLALQERIRKIVGDDKVKILFSEHSSKERDEVFDWLRSTPGSVLISPLVKEGVSINEIKAGVVADHIVSWEVANQIIGRFIRKKLDGSANEAHITWFVDRQHPRYAVNSKNLMRHLEKIKGYDFYYPVTTPESAKYAVKYSAE